MVTFVICGFSFMGIFIVGWYLKCSHDYKSFYANLKQNDPVGYFEGEHRNRGKLNSKGDTYSYVETDGKITRVFTSNLFPLMGHKYIK